MICHVRFGTLLVCVASISIAKKGSCSVCSGTRNGLSTSTRTNISIYMKQYENCTVIDNNVEINFFVGSHPDTSFLDSIEEVKGYILFVNNNFENFTMKNLKIVRGNYLFEGKSIYIEGNNNLKRIIFPSLKEVIKGKVSIKSNINLCFVHTIQWDDIIYDGESNVSILASGECGKCSEGCKSCWSEDFCQKFRIKSCKPRCRTGCLEGEPDACCSDECAGGCTGTITNCISCRNFNNSGTCVDRCPHDFYDSTLTEIVKNPNVKFHYQTDCVDKCPSSTVQYGDSCITYCPEKYYAIDNICRESSKKYSKICESKSFLDKDNIQDFVNCTTFAGHLEILSFWNETELKEYLPQFSTVEMITGHLFVQGLGESINDLSFFKNLRVIQGQRLGTAGNFGALTVMNTKLKSLNMPFLERLENNRIYVVRNSFLESFDLPSLKYIHGAAKGVALIQENKALCYVTNDTFNGISEPGKFINFANNKDGQKCEEESKICHEECIGGCWGPGNKQCRFCKHFLFQGECLATCNNLGLYVDGNECKKCDPQCEKDCYGEGPSNCTTCRNAKEGSECVERCYESRYPQNKICTDCHSDCKNGCSGPLDTLGYDGCNNCHLMLTNSNKCWQKETFDCKNWPGFVTYENKSLHDSSGNTFFEFMQICSECHPQCKSCTGEGASSEICACKSVSYMGVCMDECADQYYKDSNNSCQPCYSECDRCSGPGINGCQMCKNKRLHLSDILDYIHNETNGNIELSNETSQFICTSTCPEYLPFTKSIEIEGVIQNVCNNESPEDALASKKSSKIMVGTLVFGGICLLFIFVIILGVLRAQKAKSEENKARLQAKIEGLNDEEILSPTNAKPDLSNLRLIKESDLEKAEEIGSGAFGTVYRGIWQPEGEKVKVAVAIKVLTEGSTSAQHKELLEEARVMASVNHPCCIRILAVCLSRQMMLITPLVAHGSLLSYIRKNGPNLSSLILLKWATQIARGMAYLEQKGIVHRDLAARNILVQGPNQVKITDFGLAKLLNVDEEQFLATGGKLPVKWLALESIQHRIFTHKSDVWSYGITLWELFTYGQRPYENINAFDIAEHLEMGERLPQPSVCTIDVYMVMIKCWMIDSDGRPTFRELEEIFAEMAKDPGRFLVIMGDAMLRMPSDLFEDNRTGVIRQMNLIDEDNLICGEDYLCPERLYPTHEDAFGEHEYSNEEPSSKNNFPHLETSFNADKFKLCNQYNPEPGSFEPPRPPSLDEAEIMKMEKSSKKDNENSKDYLEPAPANCYLDMMSPGSENRTGSTHQPTFGQRGFFSNIGDLEEVAGEKDGISIICHNKID